MSNLDDQKSEK